MVRCTCAVHEGMGHSNSKARASEAPTILFQVSLTMPPLWFIPKIQFHTLSSECTHSVLSGTAAAIPWLFLLISRPVLGGGWIVTTLAIISMMPGFTILVY